MRRFKKHHGPWFARERGKHLATIALLARQESLEGESVCWQTRYGERAEHRRRARNHGDLNLGLDRGTYQQEAGVAHGWHSGVANYKHWLILRNLKNLLQAVALVVFVQAKKSCI